MNEDVSNLNTTIEILNEVLDDLESVPKLNKIHRTLINNLYSSTEELLEFFQENVYFLEDG